MPLQKYEISINSIDIVIFLTAIWLPPGQLWLTHYRVDSLTSPMLITAFLHI